MRRLVCVMALCACGDPLVEQQLIVDTRVLAARVEVTSDPQRATPAPGETVVTRALVAPQQATWQLEVCSAEPTTSGLPICNERLAFATGQDVAPELTWTLPAADVPIAVLGIVCDTPVIARAPWPAWSCAEGKRNLFHFTLATTAGGANQNPSLARDQLHIDGVEWNEDGCSLIITSSDHTLTWTVSDDNREPAGEGREELLLSHFVTAGKLERTFSRVDSAPVSITWQAPTDATDVTFYFVVRDGRGGVDWTTRTACVEH